MRLRAFVLSAPILMTALVVGSPAVAAPITYIAVMSGALEDPPNASPGSGIAIVTIDTVAHTLEVSATFADLLAPTTAAHIHGPTALPLAGTAGVMTMVPSFVNFPLGVTSGSMPATLFDLTLAGSFNPAFVTAQGGSIPAAELALALALAEGRAYFNIHTNPALGGFGGGEIRGFLVAAPEPASVVLITIGIAAAALGRRRHLRSR